jgi:predicted nucleic acid-binding protein
MRFQPPAILLDSGPVGDLSNPNQHAPQSLAIWRWLRQQLAAGAAVYLPEIADYEVRREMLLRSNQRALRRLNALRGHVYFYTVNSDAWLRAAELWAVARHAARPAADPKALDGDMILCAQAEQLGAVIATDNVGHLARFVDARRWQDIPAQAAD